MTIEDVTDLLKSIVRESSSIMQRRLELFGMFHSQEAGDLDARIDKTHKLFRNIDNKIAICNIESLRRDDLGKIIIMTCLGSREL